MFTRRCAEEHAWETLGTQVEGCLASLPREPVLEHCELSLQGCPRVQHGALPSHSDHASDRTKTEGARPWAGPSRPAPKARTMFPEEGEEGCALKGLTEGRHAQFLPARVCEGLRGRTLESGGPDLLPFWNLCHLWARLPQDSGGKVGFAVRHGCGSSDLWGLKADPLALPVKLE